MIWIYFLGERNGNDIKIGFTDLPRVVDRVATVNGEQTADESYVVLAGVRGTHKDESAAKRYFAHLRRSKGRRTEYFNPEAELVEYVNWLRCQWWSTPDGLDTDDDFPVQDSDHWLPSAERRISRGPLRAEVLVQADQSLDGPLAGTPWDWLVSPKAQIQDYFTPLELVNAAREAMGDIDLDAASHWLANREHRIPDYFTTSRSAFDNDWYGRVWLNPPYGNNAPWFDRICYFVGTGGVEQLCMISPTWAFMSAYARESVMRIASAHMLLSPTPTFWGNSEGRTGKNHPHSVIYIGERRREFLRAFAPFGIPMSFAWDEIEAGIAA